MSKLNDIRHKIYDKLGSILFRCQRIEWIMKYMVEQAEGSVEAKTFEELQNLKPKEPKWMDNKDTLGVLIAKYLDKFYGEPREDEDSETEYIRFDHSFSLNGDDDATVREKNRKERTEALEKLKSCRNNLAHHFGLNYTLQDAESCQKALEFLSEAKTIVDKEFSTIKFEYDCLQKMGRLMYSVCTSPDSSRILAELSMNKK